MNELPKSIVFLGRTLVQKYEHSETEFHFANSDFRIDVNTADVYANVEIGSQFWHVTGRDVKEVESRIQSHLCKTKDSLDSIVGFLGWKG